MHSDHIAVEELLWFDYIIPISD